MFEKANIWLSKLASEAKFFLDKKIPSLDSVSAILDKLDSPDIFFEHRVIIGGTAGKGTVCRLTEDILLKNKKTVVTLLSPHLQVITERIRINGKLISEENFGKSILKIKEISEKYNINVTYYEAIVLAGIYTGKKAGCKILIAEIGLGGEFDGVNAIRGKRIAALTFIGKDHEDILGKLKDIAKTKAGIFTHDTVLALSGEKVFKKEISQKAKIEVNFIKGIKKKLNKKISRNICKNILGKSDFEFNNLRIPARWELIDNFILDGAHSEPRFDYILPKIKKITGKKIGVFGMLKNHDMKAFEIIINEFDEIFWVDDFSDDRNCWSADVLFKYFKKGRLDYNKTLKILEYIEKNFIKTKVVVLGSFYLCGKIRNEFYPSQEILRLQNEFL